MTTRINDRDWEDLSAYLDGQLSPRDQTRLEGRLQQSADLRAALQDLRRTRAVLRAQPRLRAPRNFTLTAEMAGIRQPARPASRLSPVFGMISALASVLLIVAIFGEFFTQSPMATSRILSAEPPAASEPKGAELEMEAPPGAAVETYALEQAAPAEVFSPTLTAVGEPAPLLDARSAQEAPVGAAGAYPYPAPLEPGAAGDVLTMTTMLEAEGAPEATSVAAAPTAEIELSADLENLETSPAEEPVSQPATFWTPWRFAEILLLGVVILAGIAALVLRRASR